MSGKLAVVGLTTVVEAIVDTIGLVVDRDVTTGIDVGVVVVGATTGASNDPVTELTRGDEVTAWVAELIVDDKVDEPMMESTAGNDAVVPRTEFTTGNVVTAPVIVLRAGNDDTVSVTEPRIGEEVSALVMELTIGKEVAV
jgi:hypothetical protein